jgi:MFS family permease
MWLLYFVNGFNQSITGNLAPYITSEFEAHSLVPLIQVVSSIMGAATYMPLAKILNLWDRSVGFALMAGFATLGLILAASCKGIGVYCASQVFYSIGFTGMTFAIDVITADTSTLRDRGLAYAFTSSPYIITAYAGPAAAAKFYEHNWRWAYGSFAIILPIFAVPLVLIMKYARNQAKAKGLLPPAPEASGRTFSQSAKHYVIEFDGKTIAYPLQRTIRNVLTIVYSPRHVPSSRWPCSPFDSLQPGWIFRQWMESGLHHRHARAGHCLPHRLRSQ